MNKIDKLNLFTYATSELSQDAFICWLLAQCDNTEDIALRECSRAFISRLVDQRISTLDITLDINSLEIRSQFNHIDVLVVLNRTYAIIIEDKTNTTEHGKQLEGYKQSFAKQNEWGIRESDIVCVYLTTGNECPPRKDGRVEIYRKDILEVLCQYKSRIKSDIFLHFVEKLESNEAKFKSFEGSPVSDWILDAWKGFFTKYGIKYGEGTIRKVGQFLWAVPLEKTLKTKGLMSLMFKVMNNTIKLDLKLSSDSYEDRILIHKLIKTVPGIYENWEKPGRIILKGRKKPVTDATSVLRWKKLNIKCKESNNLTENVIVNELGKACKEYERIFAYIEKVNS